MSRGTVVDDAALIKALREKKIYAAGLDVFVNEPEVPKEYLEMDNVVLFPHLGSSTVYHPPEDGPACGRQPAGLGGGQAAAHAGSRDAALEELAAAEAGVII